MLRESLNDGHDVGFVMDDICGDEAEESAGEVQQPIPPVEQPAVEHENEQQRDMEADIQEPMCYETERTFLAMVPVTIGIAADLDAAPIWQIVAGETFKVCGEQLMAPVPALFAAAEALRNLQLKGSRESNRKKCRRPQHW